MENKLEWTERDDLRYKILTEGTTLIQQPTLGEFGLSESDLKEAESLARREARVHRFCEGFFILGPAAIFYWLYQSSGGVFKSTVAAWFLSMTLPGIILGGVMVLLAYMIVPKLLPLDRKSKDLLERVARFKAEQVKYVNKASDRKELQAIRERKEAILEQQRRADEEKLSRVKSKTYAAHWQATRGYELEQELETLFTSLGFIVKRVGKTGDEGVDLLLEKEGSLIVVQSKGWGTPIGPSVVRELIGTRVLKGISEAWLVAVNGVTATAADSAKQAGIRIITSECLANMVKTGRFH